MGIIHEEIQFEDTEVENELMVDQRDERSIRECGRNISVTVNSIDKWTPRELKAYGEWLKEQADRIEMEYDESGKPRD